jgi:hypothetical protein
MKFKELQIFASVVKSDTGAESRSHGTVTSWLVDTRPNTALFLGRAPGMSGEQASHCRKSDLQLIPNQWNTASTLRIPHVS